MFERTCLDKRIVLKKKDTRLLRLLFGILAANGCEAHSLNEFQKGRKLNKSRSPTAIISVNGAQKNDRRYKQSISQRDSKMKKKHDRDLVGGTEARSFREL